MSNDWCEVDGCPASICNGPHRTHVCDNDDLVTTRVGQVCPFCGYEPVEVTVQSEPEVTITIQTQGPPPVDPIALLVSKAEREHIDRLRGK